MRSKAIFFGVRVGIVTVIFSAGYLCGSYQGEAHAQLGGLGEEMLGKAKGMGGAVGSVAQLGVAIGEMEKHVSGLQSNIDTLKKVKAALGGK